MDERMYRWRDGWMDGWMDERDVSMNGWMDGCIDEWREGGMDGL